MKKLYSLFYILTSGLVFSQTILNESESSSRTVQDPNVVVLAQGFHATSSVSNPFVAKIGASSETPPDNPTNSNAGSGNPSGTSAPQGSSFHDTQGNIEVNGGGQLQFTLPIALPPGVKSVAPQINLVYTSGSGNGIAGYGWNISGITAISRVGRTIEKDGEMKGIQLDYSDYYSFNGQRLILKSGEYGKNGAEYVTEKFSNIKIKSIGAISGQQWQGPEYWEVTFEDGSQAWYGAIATGASTARTPVEYNIVKWKDAQGNYITYNYTQADNVAVISSIQWGGNETLGKTHFNEIVFAYSSRILKEFSYLKGISFEQTKLLYSAQVKTNGNQFKRYAISYETSNVDGDNSKMVNYQFVKSIKEYNSQNEESNPIDFATEALTTKVEEKSFGDFNDVITSGDYNGDGLVDFIVKQPAQNGKPEGYYIYFDAVNNTSPSYVYLGTTSTYFPSSTLMTFNIKSSDNIVKPKQGLVIIKDNNGYNPPSTGNVELKYYSIKSDASVLNTLNNPLILEYSKTITGNTYQFNESLYTNITYPTYDYLDDINRSLSLGYKEIDIDSDGMSELIMAIEDSKCFQQIIVPDPIKTRWDCQKLGYRYIVVDNNDIANNTHHTILPPTQKNALSKASIMDFDNDGVQDIMSIEPTGTNVTVSFYTRPLEVGVEESTLPPIIRTHSTPLNNIYQYEVKKNGDQYNLTYKNLYQIKGLTERIMFGDLNGDRNIEILAPINYRDPSSGDYYNDGWSFYLNKGNSLTEDIQGFVWNYKNGPDFWGYKFHYPVMLDLDNDGKTDFVNMLNDYAAGTGESYTSINLYKEFKYDPANTQFKWTYKNNKIFKEQRQKYILYPIYGDFRVNTSNSKILIICKPVDENSSDRRIISFTNYNLGINKNIKSITQGKVTTTVNYGELNPVVNPGLYASVKAEQYPYMEMDKVSQSYVVSSLYQIIDVGNGQFNIRTQGFLYRGLITHLQGKGMIGFRQTARTLWNVPGFNDFIWSGAEIDPLNDGVPIKEWSIKTNDDSQVFPADISENNTQLLSFKSTEYRFDKRLNGTLVDINTIPQADRAKVVSATVPIKSVSKDFMKDVRTESNITYDTTYYLPTGTTTNINNGFAVTTTNLTYIHNPSGTGKDYYIGRPASKTEQMQVYSDTKNAKEEYTYENNLLKTLKTYNRDNSGGFREDYQYDGFGNITEKKSTKFYVGFGPISLDEKIVTAAQYDSKGRFVVQKTDNLGLVTTITYNEWGQVLTQTDPLGVVLTNEYDGWGKILKSKTNLSGYTTYEYKKESNGDAVITEYSPDGNQKISYTNKYGQNYINKTKKFGQGQYVSVMTSFDLLGRKTGESEPYSGSSPTQWNTIAYDEYSRPITATAFTGKIVTTSYSGRTATITETNANNRFKKQTSDPLGNIISSEDLGGIITFKYNAAGENTEANYEGNIVKTTYDAWGNKTKFEDPSNGVYEYQYGGFMGAISKTKSPKGEKTYEYNNKGQLIRQKEKTTADNATDKTINFTYNSKGLITGKSGTSLGKAYSSGITYDSYGRVLSASEDSNGKYFLKKGITYDDKMRVTSYEKQLYSSGILTKVSIENEYDTWSGELYRVKEKGTGKVLWQLNSVNDKGQVTAAKLGNVNIANTYASNGFLNNVNHTNTAGSTVLQMSYSFNAIKNELNSRTRGGDFNIIEQFQYDDNNRLFNWTDPVTGAFTQNQQRNVYDNKGRITQNDQVGTFNFNNTQKKYQPTGMVLNDAGKDNYLNDLLQKISYNENNDPVFIDGLKGDVAFEYGLTSMRQKATYGGNFEEGSEGKFTKYYSEDGSYEVIRNNQTGQEKHLIYIGGTPYEANIVYLKNYTESSGSFKFLHKDYLGSILAITDEAGNKLEQRHFDAWGNVTHLKIGSNAIITDKTQIRDYLSNGNLIVDRGYTSHEHFAEVGLIHMNGRLYDPLLRRFLNADENIQDPYNTQNYNKYGYVLNNPLMFNDPSGEFLQFLLLAVFWKAVGIGIAVGLASAVITAGLTGQQISIGGILKSAFIGGISAAVTFGIGSIFTGTGGCITNIGIRLGKGMFYVQAGAHALAQGVLSVVQGQKFMSAVAGGFFGSLGASGWSSVMGTGGGAMIAFGALSGGIGAELAGGNFWQGAITGGIVAGLNHAMHQIGGPKATEVTDSFNANDKGTYVIVETDGLGHVYMKIDGEVFSYGRYNGSYSPSMGGYGPVGDGVMMKEGVSYLEHRIAENPSRIYKITGVNSKSISSYYNKLYNSGTPLKNGGRVINTYSLVGQNCSTTVWNSLRIGGFKNLPFINDPKNYIKTFSPPYNSNERFLRTQELMIDSKF